MGGARGCRWGGTFGVCFYSDIYRKASFKLDMVIDTTHFDTSLNELDLHSRSQMYEKQKRVYSLPQFSVSQFIWFRFGILL